ncbi:MAG: hypothetical protein JRG85_15890 [Deltaproteobacteria bacterium]|nr:hypothetical protein [Deltaproteobacteria bacterium]
MALRTPYFLPTLPALLVGLALAACSQEADVAAPAPSAEPAQVSGMYKVKGTTVVVGTDHSREIWGNVILVQDGASYTATFDLETNYPGPDGEVPAEVVGDGEGTITGNTLDGTLRTQIVASRVPGLDAHFIMVPPAFGVRVVSNATGEVKPDGSLELTIENRGAEGEDYIPTRTVVKGVRTKDE